MRKTFIDTLTVEARKNDDIFLVIGDTGFSVFEDFEAEFKNRFINVGIAEQNFIGFSSGLSAMGLKVYSYNVVSFSTLRSIEYIVLDMCYQENPVVLVGVGGGFAYDVAGPTHHAVMDIAMLRAIPNLDIFCPADPVEMKAILEFTATKEHNKPTYIRIGRSVNKVLHQNAIEFNPKKAIKMQTGEDIAIFSYGTMVEDALKTAQLLEEEGFSISVFSMPSIKPFDDQAVIDATKNHKLIVSMEEHTLLGGMGSIISEILVKNRCYIPCEIMGVKDEFAPITGTRDYLLDINDISPQKAKDRIVKLMGEL